MLGANVWIVSSNATVRVKVIAIISVRVKVTVSNFMFNIVKRVFLWTVSVGNWKKSKENNIQHSFLWAARLIRLAAGQI